MGIKTYMCKICKKKGSRKSIRKHIQEEHKVKGKQSANPMLTKLHQKPLHSQISELCIEVK